MTYEELYEITETITRRVFVKAASEDQASWIADSVETRWDTLEIASRKIIKAQEENQEELDDMVPF